MNWLQRRRERRRRIKALFDRPPDETLELTFMRTATEPRPGHDVPVTCRHCGRSGYVAPEHAPDADAFMVCQQCIALYRSGSGPTS